jgi:hypothetical protein
MSSGPEMHCVSKYPYTSASRIRDAGRSPSWGLEHPEKVTVRRAPPLLRRIRFVQCSCSGAISWRGGCAGWKSCEGWKATCACWRNATSAAGLTAFGDITPKSFAEKGLQMLLLSGEARFSQGRCRGVADPSNEEPAEDPQSIGSIAIAKLRRQGRLSTHAILSGFEKGSESEYERLFAWKQKAHESPSSLPTQDFGKGCSACPHLGRKETNY